MPSLSEFTDAVNVKYGTQSQSRYEMEFKALPTVMASYNRDILSKLLPMYCNMMTIPPLNVMTEPVRMQGAFFEVPYGISYEPLVLNFYLDRDHEIRRFFKSWYDVIYHPINAGFYFRDDYVADISLFALNRMDEQGPEYEILRAYPKSIGDIQFNATSQGDIATMQVQFVYEKENEGSTVIDELSSENPAPGDLGGTENI